MTTQSHAPADGWILRPATPGDAPAIAGIYAPFVSDTAISFEDTPPDAAEIARRIAAAQVRYPYLVAENADGVQAYAYAGPYRARHAYRYTAEVSAYARSSGHGLGSRLYRALLTQLKADGFRTCVAIITLPNAASVRFHERMGFEQTGILKQVGRKFDAWHDTGLWQLQLADFDANEAG